MAVITGYVTLPITNYATFKAATIGNSYDADLSFGCQCWDYLAEFWYNVTGLTGYPHTGPNSAAYECWTNTTSRAENAGIHFDLVTNLSDVLQGDVLVLDSVNGNAGHICFADEDYNGTNTMRIVGQNQAGQNFVNEMTAVLTPTISGAFLGAFRYREWHRPTPITTSRSKFKWVLYANKLRKRQQGV